MNRRSFFSFLGLAPLAAPGAIVAARVEPAILGLPPFSLMSACGPSLSLISNNAATASTVRQIEEQLAQHKRELPGIIVNTIHDAGRQRVE